MAKTCQPAGWYADLTIFSTDFLSLGQTSIYHNNESFESDWGTSSGKSNFCLKK